MGLFKSSKADQYINKDVQEQLKDYFKTVPHPIRVELFSQKGRFDDHVEVGRDVLTAFTELTDRIEFKEYGLDQKRARELNVTSAPTVVFAADRYEIRYMGVPLGEEGRTLVETLILIGLGEPQLEDQARRVIDELDEPRQVKVFVSSSCPYCPQQAVNAVKAAVAKPDLVSVEIVDTEFNPDLAEQYSAYSVPQTWSDEVLIGQGAQSAELFMSSLVELEEVRVFIPSDDAEEVDVDLVIAGGGPAGLSAAIYAARSGLSTVVVEKNELGGQVAATPTVENYPGLSRIGGKNLVEIMVSHALEYVKIYPREELVDARRLGDGRFQLTSTLRRFNARSVLLATGAKNRRLGAVGEQRLAGRGVSYCSTCDGPLFVGKKTAVVGGGDSAVTEALHLGHLGVDVTLIHRRDQLRAQHQLVEELEHHQVPILWNTEVREVRGEETVSELLLFNNQTGETFTRPFDGVFVSIGYDPEVDLAHKLGVDLTPTGYIAEDGRHRTNVPGVYSAGDVEGGYKQIVTAAGAGAAAAMTLFEDLTHPYWESKTGAGKVL
jgi:thioredoxin reductase (NADPH)